MIKKSSFEPDFSLFGPNSGRQYFFSKISHCQSLDIMVSFHHDKILTKFSQGRIEGQTDRQTRVISQKGVRLTSSVQQIPGVCGIKKYRPNKLYFWQILLKIKTAAISVANEQESFKLSSKYSFFFLGFINQCS